MRRDVLTAAILSQIRKPGTLGSGQGPYAHRASNPEGALAQRSQRDVASPRRRKEKPVLISQGLPIALPCTYNSAVGAQAGLALMLGNQFQPCQMQVREATLTSCSLHQHL